MRIFLVLLSLTFSLLSYAQNLEAYFNINRFDIPSDKPYIDVFISFNGRTLFYKEGKANVESTIMIKNGDFIIDFRKTKVEGPVLAGDSVPIDFVDVQRFPLKNGKYSIEINLRDLNVANGDTMKIGNGEQAGQRQQSYIPNITNHLFYLSLIKN